MISLLHFLPSPPRHFFRCFPPATLICTIINYYYIMSLPPPNQKSFVIHLIGKNDNFFFVTRSQPHYPQEHTSDVSQTRGSECRFSNFRRPETWTARGYVSHHAMAMDDNSKTTQHHRRSITIGGNGSPYSHPNLYP